MKNCRIFAVLKQYKYSLKIGLRQYPQIMTKSGLKKLRKKLPRDYRSKISSQTGYSEDYVYRVIIGEKHNNLIIDSAIALATAYQSELDSREQAIKNL